nr:MAG TPA: hypothetical protein [Caudoviricetes sp.]
MAFFAKKVLENPVKRLDNISKMIYNIVTRLREARATGGRAAESGGKS